METQSSSPYSWNQVLLEELRQLRPDVAAFRELPELPFEDPSNPDADEVARSENLRRIHDLICRLKGERQLSALCLSGGGIRSATFNLGVLQGLARLGLLDRFDYMSTVSGGGYIGGWLKAWMLRAGTARVCNELKGGSPEFPLKPEPRPLDRLREFSNYLTPRRGLLSGDTWAALAIILRNLFLNWLVVVPLLMVAAGVPQLYLLAIQLPPNQSRATVFFLVALGLALIAAVAVHRLRHPPRGPGLSPGRVFVRAVVPLVGSVVALTLAVSWLESSLVDATKLIVFAVLWSILLPLFGWSLREPFWSLRRSDRWPVREMFALIASGMVGAGLLVWSATKALPYLVQRPILYALFAVPLLLGIYLLARSLFVAFQEGFPRLETPDVKATGGPSQDADREWWARFSGYVILAALLWLILGTITLLGWHLAVRYAGSNSLSAISATGVISGLMAILLGAGADTGSGRDPSTKPSAPAWKNWTLAMAAPLFCASVLVLLAHLNALIMRWLTGNPRFLEVPGSWLRYETGRVTGQDVLLFVAVLLTLMLVGFLMGLTVNVNRFSLHGLYRNRLVRAYLGASNTRRVADPFTGFAPSDNLGLHELWKEGRAPGDVESRQPLLVVNTTLNLVRGTRLAWQERKAESFSMSSFFCGNFYEGYRRSNEYSGRGRGLTLGTALTVSGAAANPNMGYHSSPAITFLLGILNARLGAWLGNTNIHGSKRAAYTHPGPRWAVTPLFVELLGLTGSANRYVQLSDGGHFDNLGLYEMVLRRCRLIVVSDAGRDPQSGFEDLGNAIRKIRIDFGISITFKDEIRILPRTESTAGLYCAIGTICYGDMDGCGPDGDGILLYLKPTLRGSEVVPYDVFSYSRTADQFPHDPTTDQWFDESQFESYRVLGLHIIESITAATRIQSLDDLVQSARGYIKAHPPVRPP